MRKANGNVHDLITALDPSSTTAKANLQIGRDLSQHGCMPEPPQLSQYGTQIVTWPLCKFHRFGDLRTSIRKIPLLISLNST